ncbi:ATP-binding cassette domain-containing protein [Thomasclavelia sp.]
MELKNLSYSYDNKTIFSNICCELKSNHLYYLQGKNDSGKTTLLSLISGIFFNYSGDIIINKDLDLRMIDLTDFRNNLAYIPQKTDMFTGSIYDNLTMFDKEISKKIVIDKCKSVGLHDDIM